MSTDQLADVPRLAVNYGAGEWGKRQWVHSGPQGYTVHYFENLSTGLKVEFKFV